MASYQVTSPLVVAHTGDTFVHVYEGGLLPEDVDEKQLKQLLDQEMVVAVGDDGKAPKRSARSSQAASEE